MHKKSNFQTLVLGSLLLSKQMWLNFDCQAACLVGCWNEFSLWLLNNVKKKKRVVVFFQIP